MVLLQYQMLTPSTNTINLQTMNITITIGKLPPFEIEEANQDQVMEAISFVENMTSGMIEHKNISSSQFGTVRYAPKLEND